MNIEKLLFIKLRLVMAFIFLWAFFDKVFGLGFATKHGKAWIDGVSPTKGFLSMATKGPFVEIFHKLAGVAVVDWLFMLGLLFIGLTMLFNRYVFWGGLAGMILMILMWLSLLFPENNPIIDEHIVYSVVFAILAIKAKKSSL
jgi:thiosulfate dehydrogenase [quinone] large subunit